jgi:hypothetical protein
MYGGYQEIVWMFFKAFDHGVPKGLILEWSVNCENFQISYVLGEYVNKSLQSFFLD